MFLMQVETVYTQVTTLTSLQHKLLTLTSKVKATNTCV